MGRYEDAIRDLTRAIELEPDNSEVYFFRGNVYMKEEQYEPAIADYSRAASADPNSFRAYHNRAAAYYYTKNYDKAWEDVRACRRLGKEVSAELLERLEKAGKQR